MSNCICDHAKGAHEFGFDGECEECPCPEFVPAHPKSEGWWVISEDRLRTLLTCAAAGEDPDLIVAEEYANSEVEK